MAAAQAHIKDRVSVLEQRGRLLLRLPGQIADAETVYRCACPACTFCWCDGCAMRLAA